MVQRKATAEHDGRAHQVAACSGGERFVLQRLGRSAAERGRPRGHPLPLLLPRRVWARTRSSQQPDSPRGAGHRPGRSGQPGHGGQSAPALVAPRSPCARAPCPADAQVDGRVLSPREASLLGRRAGTRAHLRDTGRRRAARRRGRGPPPLRNGRRAPHRARPGAAARVRTRARTARRPGRAVDRPGGDARPGVGGRRGRLRRRPRLRWPALRRSRGRVRSQPSAALLRLGRRTTRPEPFGQQPPRRRGRWRWRRSLRLRDGRTTAHPSHRHGRSLRARSVRGRRCDAPAQPIGVRSSARGRSLGGVRAVVLARRGDLVHGRLQLHPRGTRRGTTSDLDAPAQPSSRAGHPGRMARRPGARRRRRARRGSRRRRVPVACTPAPSPTAPSSPPGSTSTGHSTQRVGCTRSAPQGARDERGEDRPGTLRGTPR